MNDDNLVLDDIPEVEDWREAERGRFFRPRKKQISIRIDMDVLHWFRSQPGAYQTRINEACREYMRLHGGEQG